MKHEYHERRNAGENFQRRTDISVRARKGFCGGVEGLSQLGQLLRGEISVTRIDGFVDAGYDYGGVSG